MPVLRVADALLRTNPVLCKDGRGTLLVVRGPRQRKNSWDSPLNMAMLDTVMRKFDCPPLYIIEDPPWAKIKCDEVFDGAHKLECLLNFLQNAFPIKKADKDSLVWDKSPLKPLVGKFYKDLTLAEQRIFDNYEFHVNIVPPEVAQDPEELSALWIRINNSGHKVNAYESGIQIYHTVYEFLSSKAQLWFKTIIYPKDKSLRGELEVILMRLLAVSETQCPEEFDSQIVIYRQWLKIKFTETKNVDAVFELKKAELEKRLKHLLFVYNELAKNGVFVCSDTTMKDKTKKDIPWVYMIARIARWFDTPQKFTHCAEPVIEYATKTLKLSYDDLATRLDVKQSNGPYQTRLLKMINRGIEDIYMEKNEPRFFSLPVKMKKLEEQGGKCAECKKEIVLSTQKMVGHHKDAYADGGTTTYDNLEVVHYVCHIDHHKNSAKRRRVD
jgi:5-methylcytosine-specific restriction endonuclease McrA